MPGTALDRGVSADMSKKELISSSYKKYVNQLKIVLGADVMLLWLSQETHESAIFSHRMMWTVLEFWAPSQAVYPTIPTQAMKAAQGSN